MARRENKNAKTGKANTPTAPVEFGRRLMIDPPALAVLRSAAREALGARRAPEELVHVVLSTLDFVATLPAAPQPYRPNLGSAARVATYVRTKYGAKRRFAGSLFLDDRLDLLGEDTFVLREGHVPEGERLIEVARRVGAAGILVFRYFRERKELHDPSAAAFARHVRERLAAENRIQSFDYLLLTPDRIASQ